MRMIAEVTPDHPPQRAAITAVAQKLAEDAANRAEVRRLRAGVLSVVGEGAP